MKRCLEVSAQTQAGLCVAGSAQPDTNATNDGNWLKPVGRKQSLPLWAPSHFPLLLLNHPPCPWSFIQHPVVFLAPPPPPSSPLSALNLISVYRFFH